MYRTVKLKLKKIQAKNVKVQFSHIDTTILDKEINNCTPSEWSLFHKHDNQHWLQLPDFPIL